MTRVRQLWLLALACGVAAGSVQLAKLTADDGASHDVFGYSVSLDGDRALVGVYGDDKEPHVSVGSAITFKLGGGIWQQEARLTAADGTSNDLLGRSVSLKGDRALVGALRDGHYHNGRLVESGAAHVFKLVDGVWQHEARLTADVDDAVDDKFGEAVSLTVDRALVGAFWDDVPGLGYGSAYVFKLVNDTWVQEAKLTGDNVNSSEKFGFSVSLFADRALVGSVSSTGPAHLFKLVGGVWKQEAKLTAVGDVTVNFGYSVSLYSDRALVGDFETAYLFKLTDGVWQQEARLTAADGGDSFGLSVSLDGDLALIGAWRDDDLGEMSGSAYVFKLVNDTWVHEEKLTAADGVSGDEFGRSVSLDGDRALVGAWRDDDLFGSAYLFSVGSETLLPSPSLSRSLATSESASSDPCASRATCTECLSDPSGECGWKLDEGMCLRGDMLEAWRPEFSPDDNRRGWMYFCCPPMAGGENCGSQTLCRVFDGPTVVGIKVQ